jgi:hypothetical protein
MMVDRQPTLEEVSVILTPKGAKPTIANLKHCIPKGMPTMVRQSTKPPKIYCRNINIPPNMIQMMLPIKLIFAFYLRVITAKNVTLIR